MLDIQKRGSEKVGTIFASCNISAKFAFKSIVSEMILYVYLFNMNFFVKKEKSYYCNCK